MCTVTYVPSPKEKSFVLTSNRDENALRPALSPVGYPYGSTVITCPKDEKAGGSWIAINENGKLACLLNGGFVPHVKQRFHTISRGTILVDFTASEKNSHQYFSGKDLKNVEPFTVISLVYKDNTVQDFTAFIWDGAQKHFKKLHSNSPYIWSSVTLYNQEQRNLRKEWFSRFYNESKENLTPENILGFHTGKHSPDDFVNVIMQRGDVLKTVSITQVTTDNMQLKMKYIDLVQHPIKEDS